MYSVPNGSLLWHNRVLAFKLMCSEPVGASSAPMFRVLWLKRQRKHQNSKCGHSKCSPVCSQRLCGVLQQVLKSKRGYSTRRGPPCRDAGVPTLILRSGAGVEIRASRPNLHHLLFSKNMGMKIHLIHLDHFLQEEMSNLIYSLSNYNWKVGE